MKTLIALSPTEAMTRLTAGNAVLIDVREADEHARERAEPALSAPLSAFPSSLEAAGLESRAVIFMCRSGARTAANCDRLAMQTEGEAYVVAGGLDAWKKAGLAVRADHRQPLELMRQVQMAAGALILIGGGLGVLVHPAFWGLSLFVGAGLFFAGATGFCGMARLLAVMPWNRAMRRG